MMNLLIELDTTAVLELALEELLLKLFNSRTNLTVLLRPLVLSSIVSPASDLATVFGRGRRCDIGGLDISVGVVEGLRLAPALLTELVDSELGGTVSGRLGGLRQGRSHVRGVETRHCRWCGLKTRC